MIWFHRSRPICSVCAARRMPAALTSESRPPSVSTAERTPSTTEPLVADVHLQRGQALAGSDLGGPRAGLVQPVGGDVGGDHHGALVQQAQRGGLPDARGGAGHQDPVAVLIASSALLSGSTAP